MKICFYVSIFLLLIACKKKEENNAPPSAINNLYPEFEEEQQVMINGYNLDAMEPFITKSGSYLFFNSLNDGINTGLYYAQKISDSEFQFMGEISGVNGIPPHLDAVASMDEHNEFYFVSTRNYPAIYQNMQHGTYNGGVVSNARPLHGDFYIFLPGWIIMDAEINKTGNELYYVNARFNGGALPEEAKLGIAVKIDTVFIKAPSSDYIFQKINDPNYIVYAPSISTNALELYYTRAKIGTTVTEICVSVRSSINEIFSSPQVIPISGEIPEGITSTDNGTRIYYHKKVSGTYKIYTMKRK